MPRVTLTQAQINAGLRSGFSFAAAQFTFSIPGAGALWTDHYAAGTQPFVDYSTLSADQGAAFRAAIAAWDRLIAPNFTEIAEDGSAANRGEIRVAFTSVDMTGGTAAYAFQGSNQTPTSSVGDIWINANSVGQSFALGTDNYFTLLHEIGHSIGLKHSFEPTVVDAPFENARYTVMSYTDVTPKFARGFAAAGGGGITTTSQTVVVTTPMVLDIAAVQGLYGADLTTASGNDTYMFDQSSTYVQAIYDAGGTDTFDLSNTTRNNIVDIRPGAYSSIGYWSIADQIAYWQGQFPGFDAFIANAMTSSAYYEWVDNVGIALSTTIENVKGGTGNDTITGNDVDNYFDLSMGGNDNVSGGLGNDAFYFGAAFTAADVIDGGDGTNDQIGLQGNYTGGSAITFAAASFVNVEVVAVMPGFSYSLTTVDANITAGGTVTFFAGNLAAGNNFTLNAAAETDGIVKVFGGLGTDIITTGAGNDAIYFGPAKFDPTIDRVNAGAGTNDQLALDGNYVVTLDGVAIQNVEVIALLKGPDATPSTYNITVANSLVGAGQTVTIWAVPVITAVTINGAGELDGALKLYGGTAGDTLVGGAGADFLFGNTGADTLTGGLGADIFNYGSAAQSTGSSYDHIVDFLSGTDRIQLPTPVTAVDATVVGGSLSLGSENADLAAALGGLGANHAILFKPTAGTLAGTTFLVVDTNGVAGYQADQDYVIQLDNNPPSVAVGDFF